jgi:diacylglycerol kinase (ATP)
MNSNKKYILVVNPISGGIDKCDIIESARKFASEGSINLTVYETTGKDDELKITNLFKLHHFERAIVAGGDGTIKLVAEALEDQDIIYGILPSGSANGLAKDLNLPDGLEENLQIAFYETAKAIDIISINGMKCLHLSDIGLNANLIKNYEEGSIRGKLGYAFHTIKTLAENVEPLQATIEYDQKRFETEANVIIIANSQKYGTGVVINPNGKINDGKFEIVVFRNLDWLMVGKILLGNMPIEGADIEIFSTQKARISTSTPVDFQIDGEYCEQITELDIQILPHRIKIAVPKAID